jgi:putative hemolysin
MNRIFTFVISLLLLTSCTLLQIQPASTVIVTNTPQAAVPNPASVYCEQQGNRLEIRTATDGGQYGVCIFADGSECDEWAYFRGECAVGTLSPISENKAVEATKIRLAQQLNVDQAAIAIYSLEKINWPDNCLGIPMQGEDCSAVETPGFRVILTTGERYYTYHTDLLGENIRQETAGTQGQ